MKVKIIKNCGLNPDKKRKVCVTCGENVWCYTDQEIEQMKTEG